MKLLKKLLPIATLASTAAVVAPMVTSCGNAIASTSSMDYTPSEKHAADKIKVSEEAAKIEQAMKDYFAKPILFAQDYCYYESQVAKNIKARLEEEEATNININFNVAVNSLTIKDEKTLSYEYYGTTITRKGYLFDINISSTQKMSYTKKLSDEEAKTIKQINESYESNGTITIKNGFVCFNYEQITSGETKKLIPSFDFGVSDLVSDDWEQAVSYTTTETIEQTGLDGKTTKNVEKDNNSYVEAKKAGDTAPLDNELNYSFDGVGSYYFSDVELTL